MTTPKKPASQNPLVARLRYHVTGAIERGEAEAITEQPAPITHDATLTDDENYILRCGPHMTLSETYWSPLARSLIARGFNVRCALDGMPAPKQPDELSPILTASAGNPKPPTTLEVFMRAARAAGADFPNWNFDGCGINGGDIYRSRLATLTDRNTQQDAGRLMAAAPALHFALATLQANPNDPRSHRIALDALALLSK